MMNKLDARKKNYIYERWRQAIKQSFFSFFFFILILLKGEKENTKKFFHIIKIVEAATILLILMMVVCFLFKLFHFHVFVMNFCASIVHYTRYRDAVTF